MVDSLATFSPQVQAAYERRRRNQAASGARLEWFISEVMEKTRMTLRKRVNVATQYLRDKVVRNISVPVVKEQIRGKTRVTERSKKGEFPRTDTTLLRKTIFSEVRGIGDIVDGYIGTPLKYGLILETSKLLDRSYLLRTLNEERLTISRMIDGPIVRE